MLRTLLCIVASPFFVLALMAIGVLAALVHLVAMPALYFWEVRLERRLPRMTLGEGVAPGNHGWGEARDACALRTNSQGSGDSRPAYRGTSFSESGAMDESRAS